MERMLRFLALTVLAACLLAVTAWLAWEPFPYSSQEAVANLAKAEDWFAAMRDAGGLAWWSSSFQGGTSLAPLWGTFLTSAWIWVCAQIFGMAAGVKIAMLACIPLSAATAFLLVRRLSGRDDVAFLGGLFYAAAPSLWIRALSVEHVVVVMAMAWLPLACWGVLRLVQHPTAWSALLGAVSCGLVALSYSKAAVLAAPVLAGLVLWGFWKHCGVAGWLQPRVGITLLVAILLLAVFPNLPALRESGLSSLFQFGPLRGWQESFATKSALQWFDRMGWLSAGFRPDFAPTTASGGVYLGLALIVSLGGALLLRPFTETDCKLLGAFRLSVGLGLLAFWFSFGPFSVVSGTLRALQASGLAWDFLPALLWLSVFLQGWMIHKLLPRRMPLRKSFLILLMAVYFLVPGFSLLEWLPLYRDIRAPFDFYQVAGVVWICAGAAIGAAALFSRLSSARWRLAALAALGLMIGWDFSAQLTLPRDRALAAGTMDDFRLAAAAIRDSDRPGSVLCLSGRYFYLLLPKLTGRPLVQEAFQNYLQQKNYAALQVAAQSSMANYIEYLRVAGVRFVVIDRFDPDLPTGFAKELVSRLRPFMQTASFQVLENPLALAPAFGADQTVLLADNDLATLSAALEAGSRNVLPVGPSLPGASLGAIREGRLELEKQPDEQKKFTSIDGILPVAAGKPSVGPNPDLAWSVVPLAWHPDWRASSGGKEITVRQAFGGMMAVEGRSEPVTFEFRAPSWYSVVMWASGVAWVACLATLLAAAVVPALRRKWDHCPEPENLPAGPTGIDPDHKQAKPCGEIPVSDSEKQSPPTGDFMRALAVTPTYNEASSLPHLLDRLQANAPSLHVLVVDDGSPDGTADIVKRDPRFGTSLFILERGSKKGLGSAYRDGFQWAADRGYEVCIEIDADLSHDPADVPRLLAALESGADAAIGSRYVDGLRVVNWPEHRLLISSFGTQFVRFFTGLPLTDATSGFKALRVAALKKLDWSAIRADGYGFQVELHHALWKNGARLVEVPITFTERVKGTTKMTAGIAWEAMKRVLQLALPQTRRES
ncbi:MAG: hypothetical protein Fur0032_14600 [Terrimicrobiaceae bacterium]